MLRMFGPNEAMISMKKLGDKLCMITATSLCSSLVSFCTTLKNPMNKSMNLSSMSKTSKTNNHFLWASPMTSWLTMMKGATKIYKMATN